MIELKGGLDVMATPEATMEFLRDPESFSRCLPNLESMRGLDGRRFEARFKLDVPAALGVGYISTVGAKMTFTIEEHREGGSRRVRISGDGRAVGSKIGIRLELTVVGTSTSSIAWEATLEGGILAKAMGEETFRQMAGTIVDEISENIGRELGSKGGDAPSSQDGRGRPA